MSLVPAPSRRTFLEQATALYEQNLPSGMRYLAERGISQQVAEKYRLGVVGGDCPSEHEKYAGRLAIPYLTRAGVVTIRFRRLADEGGAKYLSLPGDEPRLFNVGQLLTRQGDTLFIVEGELDALTVAEYAGLPCVGVQGVSAWRPVFARIIADFKEVTVVGDGDEAGAKFAHETAAALDCRAIILPDHQDANSIHVSEGPMALADLLL